MDRERRDPKTILQSAYIPCACLTFESPSLTETFVFVFVLLLVFFLGRFGCFILFRGEGKEFYVKRNLVIGWFPSDLGIHTRPSTRNSR